MKMLKSTVSLATLLLSFSTCASEYDQADLQMCVVFLCMQLKSSDMDDWGQEAETMCAVPVCRECVTC